MPPAILLYAIPGFILLLAIEAWFSYRENKALYEVKDTFASLDLGLGNVLIVDRFCNKSTHFSAFYLHLPVPAF